MTRAKIPVGFLGMLLIVGSVESYVGRRPLDFVETTALTWRFSDQAARTSVAGADLLFLGDSQVKHGLRPDLIDEAAGTRSYNLAITASTAPASYLMLRRALDAGARPRAIVVDFMPDLLAGPLRNAWRHWSLILSLPEIAALAAEARDPLFLAETAVQRLLPTARSRWEIRDAFSSALSGRPADLRRRNERQEALWTLGRGGQETPANPRFVDRVEGYEPVYKAAGSFHCTRFNRRYVDRLLSLAEAHGIQVYWLIPPVSPTLQGHRERRGVDLRYTNLARDLLARHPRLAILDTRFARFEAGDFVDPVHLAGTGAETLSRLVARAIESEQRGWIDLGALAASAGPAPRVLR